MGQDITAALAQRATSHANPDAHPSRNPVGVAEFIEENGGLQHGQLSSADPCESPSRKNLASAA